MPVVRLNHAVLYVRDLDRSLAFYRDVLGFRVIPGVPRALRVRSAFLQAPGSTNDHDLALFEMGAVAGPPTAGHETVGLYHLAWEVDTLAELERLRRALETVDAFVRSSDHGATKSVYARDPDGMDLELAWIVPADRLDDAALEARTRIKRLDMRREQERYGADTEGGIGISR
jgi:catechol 2,3-dioxygenase-like lactoylglutathione lyase family enzyme